MLILCRILLLLFCFGAKFFALTASQATVRVDVPVHVGKNRISAGTYRLVWTTGLRRTDVLISVDGRHVSFPATVEADRAPGPASGEERAITRKDGDGYVLVGFRVRGLLILLHEKR